jgi:hypothetical protein
MLVLVIKVAWQERWKAAASVISMGLVSGWGRSAALQPPAARVFWLEPEVR